MKKTAFKYNLSKGCKIFGCGPALNPNANKRKSVLYYLFVLSIWVIIASFIVVLYLSLTLPNIEQVMNKTRSPSITILDRYGKKLISINDIYGNTIEINKIPQHVWQAVIATEDKRFFSHLGIDPKGLLRAIYNNILANKAAQGGSTITQQLAKNIFLSKQKTIKRKLQEVLITLWLENKFTKEQILSAYLNRVSLVGGKYGLSIAAETIFKKQIENLNIAESAILAGMLRSPSRLNPMNNETAAISRMKTVLKLMHEQKYITDEEYINALTYKYHNIKTNFNQTRYFTDYVISTLNTLLSNVKYDIIVQTTLDSNIQNLLDTTLKSYLKTESKKYNFSEAATVILNNNGEILALIGGSNYNYSQFNRVSQMKRQPGSIFKPFVYLAGLESGLNTSDTFIDEPTTLAGWTPKNHDGKYLGYVSMGIALEKSLNTVPVQIAKQIGLHSIIKTAKKLGLVDKLSNDYSIILGTSETTLLDLTAAYATFANNGFGVIPHSITKITTSSGDIIYNRNGSGVGSIINLKNVNEMNSMLKNVIKTGTGTNANINGKTIYGKTGTSQDNRDAWFIGYSDKYIMGIWIGNDDNSPMASSSYGGTIPAKIFKTVMTHLLLN